MRKCGIQLMQKLPFLRGDVDKGDYNPDKGIFSLYANPDYMPGGQMGFDVDFSYQIVQDLPHESYLCLHAQKDSLGGLQLLDVWHYVTLYTTIFSESKSAWLGVDRSDGFALIGRGRFTLKINTVEFRHTLGRGWVVL